MLQLELTKNHQDLVFPLFWVGIAPSTLPAASRISLLHQVAPVSFFPDRLRLRSEQAGALFNYFKKESHLDSCNMLLPMTVIAQL